MSGRTPDAAVFPVNQQDWEDVTFLHWEYHVDVVQSLLPSGLHAQSWEGRSFVGVTPFRMARVRLPGMPAIPRWRAFPELNIRTYVSGPGERDGIWFLGMLVSRMSFATVLRSLGLPYLTSDSEISRCGNGVSYRFGAPGLAGSGARDWFTATTEVGAALSEDERTPLVDSLTGRWSAFHRRAGLLWRTPVEHEPWPLHRASVSGSLTSPLRWVGLPEPQGPPLVHASPGVHTRLGSLRPA